MTGAVTTRTARGRAHRGGRPLHARLPIALTLALTLTAALISACGATRQSPAAVPSAGTLLTADGARLAYASVAAEASVVRPLTVVVLHGGPGATHGYLAEVSPVHLGLLRGERL